MCAGANAQHKKGWSVHLLLTFSSANRNLLGMGWKLPGTHLLMQPEDFCAPLKVQLISQMWRDAPLKGREFSWEGIGMDI